MAYTREKMREYQRNWIAASRRSFFCDKSCARCGSTEQLELDHIDPSTKIASCVWSWAPARRAAEIAKCQVLCNACHKLKTTQERIAMRKTDADRECGTVAKYQRGNCRCDPCKAAQSQRLKRQRMNNKLKANPPA